MKIEVTITHNIRFVGEGFEASPLLGIEVLRQGALILQKLELIMHTLDDTLAEVTDEGTKIDSVLALVAGLKQQVADALAGTALPPAVQAKIDAVFDGVAANKAKVQTALDANVPPAA